MHVGTTVCVHVTPPLTFDMDGTDAAVTQLGTVVSVWSTSIAGVLDAVSGPAMHGRYGSSDQL